MAFELFLPGGGNSSIKKFPGGFALEGMVRLGIDCNIRAFTY